MHSVLWFRPRSLLSKAGGGVHTQTRDREADDLWNLQKRIKSMTGSYIWLYLSSAGGCLVSEDLDGHFSTKMSLRLHERLYVWFQMTEWSKNELNKAKMCACFTWHVRRVVKKWITKTFFSNRTRDESDRFIHVLHNQRQNMVSDKKHE